MEVGVLLYVVSDLKDHLVTKGILSPNGQFGNLTIGQDIELATVIEKSLKAHGVIVQDQVDKVLAILPLVLQLAGVK